MNKQKYIELRNDLKLYESNLQFYQYQAENYPNDEYWIHHIEQTRKFIVDLKNAIDKEMKS